MSPDGLSNGARPSGTGGAMVPYDYLRRVPPQNLEAEASVLGAVILENDCLPQILEILRPDDFYRQSHEKIFRAMLAISEAGTPIDLVTLSDHLKQRNELEAVDGTAYLASLAEFTPTVANVRHHAGIVKKCAQQRGLFRLCSEGIERVESYEPGNLASEMTSRLAEIVSSLKEKKWWKETSGLQSWAEFVSAEHNGAPYSIDGIAPDSGLIAFHGRGKGGKSTMLIHAARAIATGATFLDRATIKKPVVYLNYEMGLDYLKQLLTAGGPCPEEGYVLIDTHKI